jgi:hypothetical protein
LRKKKKEISVAKVEAFPNCEKFSKALTPVSRVYAFEDLACAAFCLSSWSDNRSAQTLTLALNAVLVSLEEFGDKRIISYEQFGAFCDEVVTTCPLDMLEDYVFPFWGHTKLEHKNRWHNALYGCGAVQEYPRLCFVSRLSEYVGSSDDYESVLVYIDSLVAALGKANSKSDNTSEEKKLCIPSREYWEATCVTFQQNLLTYPTEKAMRSLSAEQETVLSMHFIKKGEKWLPLFNASILSDYAAVMAKTADIEQMSACTNSVIAEVINDIFPLTHNHGDNAMQFPVFKKNGELVSDCPVTFITIEQTGRITLYCNEDAGQERIALIRKKGFLESGDIDVIEGIADAGGKRNAITIKGNSSIDVVVVCFQNHIKYSLAETSFIALDERRGIDYFCSSLDLLTIVHAAKSIEEMSTFVRLEREEKSGNSYFSLGGKAPHFLWWQANNRQITSGAEDKMARLNVYFDYNETDYYYLKLFTESCIDYPFLRQRYLLGSPFRWVFEENERGFKSIKRKLPLHEFGHIKALNSEKTTVEILDDLLMCAIRDTLNETSQVAIDAGGFIQIEYVPETSEIASKLPVIDKSLGLRCARGNNVDTHIVFSIDKKSLFLALSNATSREIECRVASKLLSHFPHSSSTCRESVKRKLCELGKNAKVVDMKELAIPYVWRGGSSSIGHEHSRGQALKTIAEICFDLDIKPANYYESEANEILRKLQRALQAEIEKEIFNYDAIALHFKLGDLCAAAEHEVFVHTSRFLAFGEVDDQEKVQVRQKALELKEEARGMKRAARFLIELSLSSKHSDNHIILDDMFSYITELAKQLMFVQDNADLLFFSPKNVWLEVADNYIASIRITPDDEKLAGKLRWRQAEDSGYLPKGDSRDKAYIEEIQLAFKKDTQIDFGCLLDVIAFLSRGFIETIADPKWASINMVRVKKDTIIEKSEEYLLNVYSAECIERVLDFLILDLDKIRSINGQLVSFLPFNRVKDRPNRYELKPILLIDDMMVYSPVSVGLLGERWVKGIGQHFLPCKAGYERTDTAVQHWKTRYEKLLESDTRDIFVECGFHHEHVYKGLELHKKGNHPKNLGDYDVFAFQQEKSTIWIVECKVFERVESPFDYMQLQHRWFGDRGKLQKFERRIKYVEDNAAQILADLGIAAIPEVAIRAILVSNKVFKNMIDESNFEIASYPEFKGLLKENGT